MAWNERTRRRLKLRDLHILRTVAEAGSMGRAAKALAMSQPAVSKGIADLEDAVGVPLLERTPLGTEPTRYGRVLLASCTAVFDDLQRGLREVEFLRDPSVGELEIGCWDPLAAGFAGAVIDRLSGRFSKVMFHVRQGDQVSLLHELQERRVELILIPTLGLQLGPATMIEPLFDDHHVVIAAQTSRWARRRKLRIAELIEEPWVLAPANSIGGRYIDAAFRAAGVDPPRARVDTFSIPMHQHLLATGRYLTSLPRSMVYFGRHMHLKALPVQWPAQTREVAIVTLRGRALSPVAQSLVDELRIAARALPPVRRVLPN
jgi:DNA-binding transcriptional LysR family regulator